MVALKNHEGRNLLVLVFVMSGAYKDVSVFKNIGEGSMSKNFCPASLVSVSWNRLVHHLEK